ncbi:cytochrome c oxidase assembly protein [Brevibacterium antiquum]|uniref:cytochrome c oxidase assembly protein n=1 Tax=Brevibacterium antiquum TaxID=234835 RepID=UPI0018DF721A|nr:cytochrome c oxidase assembly protein [Brevibacterium antiquum]
MTNSTQKFSVEARAHRRLMLTSLAIAVLVTTIVLVTALEFSGVTDPRQLLDPGALVRWALPIMTTIHHLAMSLTWAALVFAVTVIPHNDDSQAVHKRTMSIALVAATVWTLAAVAMIILGYADTSGQALSGSDEFASQLLFYVFGIILGQAWGATAAIAALTATLIAMVSSRTGITIIAVVSLAAVIPLSQLGHVAGVEDHDGAVNALALHYLGAGLWTGGIVILAAISPILIKIGPQAAERVLPRFSGLALIAFCLVVVSGVINTVYRLDSWAALASVYGALVIVKTLATVALGLAGYLNRRLITAQGARKGVRSRIWQMIAGEVIVLSAVMALGAVLARTNPGAERIREPDITPAEVLTDYVLPPPLGVSEWVTQWRFDWLWIAATVLPVTAYIYGVLRLRAQGQTWPVLRTVAFVSGLVVLIYMTSGVPNIYAPILLSIHTLRHLALAFVVPMLLLAGHPHHLINRLVQPRTDGTTGWYEIVHGWKTSTVGQLLSRPSVTAVLVVAVAVGLYYTPMFPLALNTLIGQELMNTAALVAGLIFTNSVLTTSAGHTGRNRQTLTVLTVAIAVGAWAVLIAVSPTLLQPEWFTELGREWGLPPLSDQHRGATSIVLAGFMPLLVMAVYSLFKPDPSTTAATSAATPEMART